MAGGGPAGVAPAGALAVRDRPSGETGYADMTIYEAAGGALVFATGSMYWSWGLDGYNAPAWHTRRVSEAAQRITRNVLDRMLAGSADESNGAEEQPPPGPALYFR